MTLAKTVSVMMMAAISASTLTLSVSTTQAQAGRPNQSDFYSTNGHSVPPAKDTKKYTENKDPLAGRQGAGALYSDASPQLTWFESFDDYTWSLYPSEGDRAILARPINQELERVQDYIKVVAKLSKNYRLLAKKVRGLNVPEPSPGLKDYQSLRAGFYDDMATVYDDLIRPRRTRTQEELQAQLKEIEERANQLKINSNNLLTMDSNLRRKYRVHAPKQTDALRQYVENKTR